MATVPRSEREAGPHTELRVLVPSRVREVIVSLFSCYCSQSGQRSRSVAFQLLLSPVGSEKS